MYLFMTGILWIDHDAIRLAVKTNKTMTGTEITGLKLIVVNPKSFNRVMKKSCTK